MSLDTLHNAETAAALIGVRPSTIRHMWSTGRLPRTKVGRLTKVREYEVLALLSPQPLTQNKPAKDGK